ncbi:tRNA (N6-threonylcarbamoyladenosine(37)-N6)-methyltransferase TrmO [Spartinivicinus poritis]|uniref:tRNA (N6-threonylcarbamoyladenosine(37)-N6)-methyltransferase TrmO n=1 Tax=Spartinivicinus poritis TaxID=2994640 RepID=A0ABT5UBS9_9GAMM|nr:tRNA (N6-threonylcarbamoyladenosine(37)-N6)-methyltransferase TrmO [Spartinivicinus sp. A2-2]MDE1462957.1 tRNA (N6-threonylcarbamoyladenosine(37)-N6)-methyltransferase TrmO [Spartinivicinus sp. A2-2]
MDNLTEFTFKPIGIIHSCFTQKFGIPRQPGLVTAATAELALFPPFNRRECFTGLEVFSHLWVSFIFHETLSEGWRPTIRPPRLGGKKRVGVFASRSTHRPNPIGLSVVKLESISQENDKLSLQLSEIDLLDGTPVIDIKPYLPYSDYITDASDGFAPPPLINKPVTFSQQAQSFCDQYQQATRRNLSLLTSQVLSQDPRPAYLQNSYEREYGIQLWDVNIRWHATPDDFYVNYMEPVNNESDPSFTAR